MASRSTHSTAVDLEIDAKSDRREISPRALIARTCSAAARPGRPSDGGVLAHRRTRATYASSDARSAPGSVAGKSRADFGRDNAWSPPWEAAAATAAVLRSRTIASLPRAQPPTGIQPAASPWSPARRTPCRPPRRSWRDRVAASPRPGPVACNEMHVCDIFELSRSVNSCWLDIEIAI